MYYYYFIIAAILRFHSCTLDDRIDIEIKIDSVKYIYKNELALYGNLKIINKTDKTLKFPKSFDLYLTLSDSLNNLIPHKKTIIEEVNLINLRRRIKISPFSSKNIKFIETRLSDYRLDDNNFYNIKYVLKKNQQGINLDKNYETNTCKFRIPGSK